MDLNSLDHLSIYNPSAAIIKARNIIDNVTDFSGFSIDELLWVFSNIQSHIHPYDENTIINSEAWFLKTNIEPIVKVIRKHGYVDIQRLSAIAQWIDRRTVPKVKSQYSAMSHIEKILASGDALPIQKIISRRKKTNHILTQEQIINYRTEPFLTYESARSGLAYASNVAAVKSQKSDQLVQSIDGLNSIVLFHYKSPQAVIGFDLIRNPLTASWIMQVRQLQGINTYFKCDGTSIKNYPNRSHKPMALEAIRWNHVLLDLAIAFTFYPVGENKEQITDIEIVSADNNIWVINNHFSRERAENIYDSLGRERNFIRLINGNWKQSTIILKESLNL